MKLYSIILLSSFLQCTVGISCYYFNSYENHPDVIHDQDFCFSLYEKQTGSPTFGGGLLKNKDEVKNSTCSLITTKNIKSSETHELYRCDCVHDYCNYPLTFTEFQSRNYTINPIYPSVDSTF